MARIVGSSEASGYIVVGAHYDTVDPPSRQRAPGADGDGSGVVAVIELARILTAAHATGQYNPVHSVYFILFDAGMFNR
eukprot:SAG31_NODE_12823_length_914_cov_1.015951_1_plen_79_part_00